MMRRLTSTLPALTSLLLALGVPSSAADTPYSVAIIDRDLWIGQDSVELTTEAGLARTASMCLWVDPASGRDGFDGGFDFLVCYDVFGLTPSEIRRGVDLHPDWEYFSWRAGQFGDSCAVCPQGYVRVLGIADLLGGITPPDEAFHVSGCIAELDFFVTSNEAYADSSVPVGFCALDCGDNVISSRAGDSLYFPSLGVVHGPDYDSAACVSVDPPVRTSFAEYHPGAIHVGEWTGRGDINLNGIGYDVADAVLFSRFFMEGDSAFSSDPLRYEAQIRASDTNCDDIPATTVDLSYLINVITGDQYPCDGDGWPRSVSGPTPSLVDSMHLSSAVASVGDTFTVDLYLRNEDTLGVFNLRLRYDPSLIEPLTDTSDALSVEAELLRGTSSFEAFGGTTPEPGEVIYAAADFDLVASSSFVPGAGVTLRMPWRVLPSAGNEVTTIAFEDRSDLPYSYNTFADRRATIWKQPVLTDGEVTITECYCPYQGDMDTDGYLTAVDLALYIDCLFFCFQPPIDPLCPVDRLDLDCDGFGTALDLALIIDHLFDGGPGPCNPCSP